MKRKKNPPQRLVWFNGLGSSQNGKNGLIRTWCIGGCSVTAALYNGSIPAKKSWTQYQDHTSKKVQKSRQHQDQHCRGKQSHSIVGKAGSRYVQKSISNKASQTHWPCRQIQCCTSAYCVYTWNTKTIHSNLNSLNTFIKETNSPNVKLVLIRYNSQKLDPMLQSLSLWGQGPTNIGEN